MTEPKRPKVSGSIVVSEFKRGAEAVRDVILPMLLEPIFTNISDPTVNGSLRLFAQHLIDNPDLIPPSPWKPVILEILRQFVIDHPLRKLDNAAIADAVDLLLLKTRTIANQDDPVVGKWELAQARNAVAKALGKDSRAVAKAHQRDGKYRAT